MTSTLRVLMPICQRLGATGSGVVVNEIARLSARTGIELFVMSGVNEFDPAGPAAIPSDVRTAEVRFNTMSRDGLPFPVVGMSDRMPYPTRRFRDLTRTEVDAYLRVWTRHVKAAIAAFQPDLIHVHHLWLLAAVCASARGEIPVCVSIHGTDLMQAAQCPELKAMVAERLGSLARFIALTPETVRDTKQLYSVADERFDVLGNGFNEQLFTPSRFADPVTLERYGLDKIATRRIVLFVGKYVEWKGIHWLISAFNSVRLAFPDALLVIAGGGPETERRAYSTTLEALHLKHDVLMTGELAYRDVGAIMSLATVFVLPSFGEPFGLALLEAMACGLRVVAVDQAGPAHFVPSVLRDRRDAILVAGLSRRDAGSAETDRFVQELAAAITEQLGKPTTSVSRHDIAAAVQHLTWDVYMQALMEVYRRCLSEGAAHV